MSPTARGRGKVVADHGGVTCFFPNCGTALFFFERRAHDSNRESSGKGFPDFFSFCLFAAQANSSSGPQALASLMPEEPLAGQRLDLKT
jgi:hypothetical protein